MIEESKLAKTFRKDEEKKVESWSPRKTSERLLISGGAQNEDEAVVQAQRCKEQLQALLAGSTFSGKNASEPQAQFELVERAKALLPTLTEIIRTCSDSARLDELLSLNDTLISLLARASPKPKITLQGLGIELNGLRELTSDAHRADNGGSFLDNHVVTPLGGDSSEELMDDDGLSTPRLDKGKGRAAPEPEIVEPVLSPRGFAVADSDEDEIEHEAEQEGDGDPRSPTDL
jgi:protein phosphatase 1 regulatory subunit 37